MSEQRTRTADKQAPEPQQNQNDNQQRRDATDQSDQALRPDLRLPDDPSLAPESGDRKASGNAGQPQEGVNWPRCGPG